MIFVKEIQHGIKLTLNGLLLTIDLYISPSSSEKLFIFSEDGNKHTGPQLVVGQRIGDQRVLSHTRTIHTTPPP